MLEIFELSQNSYGWASRNSTQDVGAAELSALRVSLSFHLYFEAQLSHLGVVYWYLQTFACKMVDYEGRLAHSGVARVFLICKAKYAHFAAGFYFFDNKIC